MPGRVEAYLHSDRSTIHKGGAMIRVTSETDFGARTDDFISFSRIAAKHAYACQATSWDEVAAAYEPVEEERRKLERSLKETVTVEEIVILTL